MPKSTVIASNAKVKKRGEEFEKGSMSWLVTNTYSCMAPQIKIGHLFPLFLHKIVTNNIKKQVGYLISYSELHTNSFLQNEERYRGMANYEKLHTPSLYLCLPCLIKIWGWSMQPLVSLVFPSLYPSFRRNDFLQLYCSYNHWGSAPQKTSGR